MNALIVSTSDFGGGAYIAAHRLEKALNLNSVSCKMLVREKLTNDQDVLVLGSPIERLAGRFIPILDQVPTKLLLTENRMLHSPSWVFENTAKKINSLHSDIVNLHWINWGFLRPESISKIKAPVVWTLHDMWAFSGSEHHTNDLRYVEGYKSDNRPKHEFGFDLNRWVWERKKKSWKNLENITIVTPSRWLAQLARQSFLFRDKRIVVIPNGIDTNIFKPRDEFYSRKLLGLPPNKKIILFGAQFLSMPWKGIDLLADIIKKLQPEFEGGDYLAAIYGKGYLEDIINMSKLDPKIFRNVGFFSDERKLSFLYSAADLFVVTSRNENLPNTIMESMSCGTPAIAFDVGGISDLIDNKVNGFLIRNFNIELFAKSIKTYFQNKSIQDRMRISARNKVLEGFDINKVAERYKKLYDSILEKKTNKPQKRFQYRHNF